MINYRQKEYSSLGTKLSLGLEQTREFLRGKTKKNLEKKATDEANEVKKRAAKIELTKPKYTSKRSSTQVKRDAITTRDSIKSAIKNPSIMAQKAGKMADKAIQATIRRPQVALGAVSSVAIPTAASMINPVAGAVMATVPVGTTISLLPTPPRTNQYLKQTARKYRETQFSKRLGGRI